jgi:uncharacterized Tic20 family protein
LFAYEIIGGILHGFIITVATIAAYKFYIVDKEGHNSDFWSVSIVIYTVLIIVTNLMTLIRSSHITWLLIISIFLTSIGPFIIWMIFYDRWTLLNVQSEYSVRFILKQWHFYQAVILNTFFISFYEICKFFLKYYVNPTMVEYTHQLRKKELIKDDQFWQEDLIKIVKKNSSKVRLDKKRRKNKKNKKAIQDEIYSAKLVRSVTHG